MLSDSRELPATPALADGKKRVQAPHLRRKLADIPLATTRRTHITTFSRVFAFIIVLSSLGVFEGARRDETIRLAQFNYF